MISVIEFSPGESRTFSREARSESDNGPEIASAAGISTKQVPRMTSADLARVVRAGRIPETSVHIEYLDRGTLERLAHLACFSRRNHP